MVWPPPVALVAWLCVLALALCGAAGTTLTDVQNKISVNVDAMPQQLSWVWNVKPLKCARIQFVFEKLSVGSAELHLSVVRNSRIDTVFSCVDPSSCLSIPPAPFYVDSDSVTVTLTFNSNALNFRSTSFILHYVGLFDSQADADGLWQNLTLPLKMPYAKIDPALVGGMFPPWGHMKWSIDVIKYFASDLPSSSSVASLTFSVAEFAVPDDCSIVVEIYNTATIQDSSLVFSGCKPSDFTDRWLYTSGAATVVMFSRNGEYRSAAIQLIYTSSAAMQNCGFIASPEQMVASTMMVVDGSGDTNKMRSGQTCSWLLQPPGVKLIMLLMSLVSIHPDATFTVSDGTGGSSNMLWTCKGCQFTVPPPLYSTTGSMYLQFSSSSRSSTAYKGFVAEYSTQHADSHGVGSNLDKLYMSTAFGLRPPGNGIVYSSDLQYGWLIAPTTKSAVYLSIYNLDIRDCNDSLVVHDGADAAAPALQTFSCGSLNPNWIISSESSLFLAFYSDADSSVSPGFEFSFYADGPNYQCGLSTSPMVIRDPSMIISDGSSASEKMHDAQSCRWIIDPGEGFNGLTLYFTRFSLLGGQLTLSYEGSTVTIANLDIIPPPVVLAGRSLTVTYTSDSIVSGYGFQAEYFAVHADQAGPGDSIVELYASSMIDLKLPVTVSGSYASSWTVSWLIVPRLSPGISIFLSFSSLYLPDCNDTLTVYDGDSTIAPVIGEFCGTQLPTTWVQSSGSALYLEFSSNAHSNVGTFSLSYNSDGPNYHCGFLQNPGVFTAPSMVIGDGSMTSDVMFAGQECEFLLQPPDATHVVLHLEFVDMRGGSLQVFGADDYLLWECIDCEVIPTSLLARKTMRVLFRSSSQPIGTGFRAFYASLNTQQDLDQALTSTTNSSTQVEHALLSPQQDQFVLDPDNSSAWYLSVTAAAQAIVYKTGQNIINTSRSSESWSVIDGRPEVLLERLYPSGVSRAGGFCGFVIGPQTAPAQNVSTMLKLGHTTLRATNTRDAFIFGRREFPGTAVGKLEHAMFEPSNKSELLTIPTDQQCRYVLEGSGDEQAVIITISACMPSGMQVYTFGGLDAFSPLLSETSSSATTNSGSGVNCWARGVTVVAPCGRASIQITSTTPFATVTTPTSAARINISFVLDPSDTGLQKCAAYRKSLEPPKDPPPDFWSQFRLLLIGCGVIGVVVLVCFCNTASCKRVFRLIARARQRYLPVMYAEYPRHAAIIDYCRNQMLPEEACVICNSSAQSVKLECSHFICIADITSYIQTALGDVSLFPVRCPMHFDGCKGLIGADVAKRFLDKSRYVKFLEFQDRCIYGEGMRCIFCCKFVNFPAVMYVSMVECPYCSQRFCLRCKNAWHVGAIKCPLDRDDETLESWRLKRGAQKCPGCMKIIEKEDPSTCNHMVHKSTDAIPCLRERTDFCYLCGVEVLSDYPHDEVQNPGVNHFPSGVFQDCRTVTEREQERIRRRKKYRRTQWIGGIPIVPIDALDAYRPQSAPQALETDYMHNHGSAFLQPTDLSPISNQPRRAMV